jgi:formamidopyrimidine-DNA glycosylase
LFEVPELPEVEARKNYLQRTSLGLKIESVKVLDKRILVNTTPAQLANRLKGAAFTEVDRRGKYLLVGTDTGGILLMHFGMTGSLLFDEKGGEPPRFDRVEFRFRPKRVLYFIDQRLFGKIALYPTSDRHKVAEIADLGPEPLDRSFTYRRFSDIVRSHNTTIHQLLMDQGLIAGIGNIYSDEITYQAGVRPDKRTSKLTDEEIRRLYDKMKRVLRRAVQLDAELDDQADRFLIPNRNKDGECPGTHHRLEKKTIGGRTSYYCPICQK